MFLIDQKQKIYYYIGQQEDDRATVKKRKKNKIENREISNQARV